MVEVGKRKLVLQRISLSVIRRCDERSRADAAQLTVAMHQLGVKTIVARQKWGLSVNLWFRQMHNLQKWHVIIKSRPEAWSWNCVELCWHDISYNNIFPDLNCESRTINKFWFGLESVIAYPSCPEPLWSSWWPWPRCTVWTGQSSSLVRILDCASDVAPYSPDQHLRGGGRHPPHLHHQSGQPRGEQQ